MDELPDKEKASHSEVKYERPSARPERYCGNCHSLVERDGGNHCKTVVDPIWLNGWCNRWPGKR